MLVQTARRHRVGVERSREGKLREWAVTAPGARPQAACRPRLFHTWWNVAQTTNVLGGIPGGAATFSETSNTTMWGSYADMAWHV